LQLLGDLSVSFCCPSFARNAPLPLILLPSCLHFFGVGAKAKRERTQLTDLVGSQATKPEQALLCAQPASKLAVERWTLKGFRIQDRGVFCAIWTIGISVTMRPPPRVVTHTFWKVAACNL
jgi:hypothetical protein